MNLLKDFKPDLNVNEAEYKRLLGYPYNHQPEGKANDLVDWVKIWYKKNGSPWVYSILFDNLKTEDGFVKIENIGLSSKTLYDQFQATGTSKAVLVLVSAGKECEEESIRLWEENKPDEYFFLEVFGSAVVENLISASGHFLCSWSERNDSGVLPHYSPGYAGWKIEDQKELWKLFQKRKSELPGKIDLLDSGMLNPKKSMIALFGITDQIEYADLFSEYLSCKRCSFSSCRYRRSPHMYWRRQIEDEKQLNNRT